MSIEDEGLVVTIPATFPVTTNRIREISRSLRRSYEQVKMYVDDSPKRLVFECRNGISRRDERIDDTLNEQTR